MIPSELTVLSTQDSAASAVNLAKIANFLGLDVKLIRLGSETPNLECLEKELSGRMICVAASSSALANLFQSQTNSQAITRFLFERVGYLFVYGFSPNDSQSQLLKSLTDGGLNSVSRLEKENPLYHVSACSRSFSRQFSGLSFGPVNRDFDSTFVAARGDGSISTLISIDGKPFLVRLKKGNAEIYLLATTGIADIDGPVPRGASLLRQLFSQLMPAMMFIRYVFGAKCWHSAICRASFIIDDPLLRETYGFLNYRTLLEKMDEYGFSTTIAFIPWNYRRTRLAVAKLFRERPDRFSLAIHGCDHTEGEFGSLDTGYLNRKIKRATRRMVVHKELTKVDFEKVMVFPQGVFSRKAMRVLKVNNFLAAVNSSSISVDENSPQLKIRDVLGLAVMNYENFPLFVRRYPKEIIDFAFDLFLGKPALIVEHHLYFKNGYGNLVDCVGQLNALEPRLRWASLGEIITHSYLQKAHDCGITEIAFYGRCLALMNRSQDRKEYVLCKQESDDAVLDDVTLNGRPVDYKLDRGILRMSTTLEPGESTILVVKYASPSSDGLEKREFLDSAKVFLRRHLSEWRDNHLSRSQVILTTAQKLKHILPRM